MNPAMFATIDSSVEHPLPVIAVGAGEMGRAWLSVLEQSHEVDLVGIVDLDQDAAHRAAAAIGRPQLPVGTSAVGLAADTAARAVIDITVPSAHHPVTQEALIAGLPVLGEKPAAATLAEALSLAATAEATGQLFMVSQSRRWNPQVAELRGLLEDIGPVGTVTTEFFRAPRFGGFREQMDHPLLLDMAIHAFDTARFLLDADPLAVYCDAYNPPWSWYLGAANAAAVFEMEGGARYVYTGSWCAPGDETSWNGRWHASGQYGSATWDGETDPVARTTRPAGPHEPSDLHGIAGALRVFCAALRTGTTPMGEVHENVLSLAMVEAARESADTGRRVFVDDVLNRAHRAAVRAERNPQTRAMLTGWTSVRQSLAAARPQQGAA